MHIAAVQWESEQSVKRDCASGHTYELTYDHDDDEDDIWQWWHIRWWSYTIIWCYLTTGYDDDAFDSFDEGEAGNDCSDSGEDASDDE